tara:strand:- start:170 stop:796 length:627 start_codon:yes stop_codon:yes gene_type:complete
MTINWQQLFQQRKAAEHRFGSIWNLPVRKRYHVVLGELGGPGVQLLEIGAGDRGLAKTMESYWQAFEYKSCDIDPTYPHDFSSSSEIEGEYDLIVGCELIEHLSLQNAAELLLDCFAHTKRGGKIMLTTPNTFYPPGFMRDATHITPFCYDELAGLLAVCGFNPTGIYRLYHDSLVKRFIKRVLFYPVFRVVGIDFAHQIAVVAEKPA